MSGWRSGSAPPGSRIEWADWAGAGRTPSRREGVLSAIVLAVLVGIVLVSWIATETHRPPHRVLPAPARPAVLLVPIGEFPADRLADAARDYSAEYGLAMTVAAPIALPQAIDPIRGQFAAQDLIAAATSAHPEARAVGTVVIGVTAADMYIRGVAWRFAFALRESGQFAVVSIARMPNARNANLWQQFRKMLTRQVGFLCYGLPPSDNPYDVLYRDILGGDDLRRVFDHL